MVVIERHTHIIKLDKAVTGNGYNMTVIDWSGPCFAATVLLTKSEMIALSDTLEEAINGMANRKGGA